MSYTHRQFYSVLNNVLYNTKFGPTGPIDRDRLHEILWLQTVDGMNLQPVYYQQELLCTPNVDTWKLAFNFNYCDN